jgi:hypothetical protein
MNPSSQQNQLMKGIIVFIVFMVVLLAFSIVYLKDRQNFGQLNAGTTSGDNQPSVPDHRDDDTNNDDNSFNPDTTPPPNPPPTGGTTDQTSGDYSSGSGGGSEGGGEAPLSNDLSAPTIIHTPRNALVETDLTIQATIKDDRSPPAAVKAYIEYFSPICENGVYQTQCIRVEMHYIKGYEYEGIIPKNVINELYDLSFSGRNAQNIKEPIVIYRIIAFDEAGNMAKSSTYNVRIIGPNDTSPPTIFHEPTDVPIVNADFTIYASIQDDITEPSMIIAYTEYRIPAGPFERQNSWTRIDMTYTDPNHIGSIPQEIISELYEQQLPQGSGGYGASSQQPQLEYRITAIDEAGNTATTQSFIVRIING